MIVVLYWALYLWLVLYFSLFKIYVLSALMLMLVNARGIVTLWGSTSGSCDGSGNRSCVQNLWEPTGTHSNQLRELKSIFSAFFRILFVFLEIFQYFLYKIDTFEYCSVRKHLVHAGKDAQSTVFGRFGSVLIIFEVLSYWGSSQGYTWRLHVPMSAGTWPLAGQVKSYARNIPGLSLTFTTSIGTAAEASKTASESVTWKKASKWQKCFLRKAK